MYMPPNTRLLLDPRDDFTHTPETASNYNESMYFNAFDTAAGLGLWLRLGNRPHEGHAEMTVCVYLPDGRVGFMYARPAISDNSVMDAGGLRIDVLEPFQHLRVRYAGELLLMDDPLAMADPSSAFKRYPKKPALIELDFHGVSPMHGGEIVTLDGQPVVLDPEHAVYRGHTEQNMAVQGHVTVDGQRHAITAGTGYRDKSWGPRHWHRFYWYKWLPVTFNRDFGLLLSIKGRPDGPPGGPHRISGNVLRNGVVEPVLDGHISTDYGPDFIPRALDAWVQTDQGRYAFTARVLATVPLRHKRAGGGFTRITESLSDYRCGDMCALGMAEYCDVMQDGVPISVALDKSATTADAA